MRRGRTTGRIRHSRVLLNAFVQFFELGVLDLGYLPPPEAEKPLKSPQGPNLSRSYERRFGLRWRRLVGGRLRMSAVDLFWTFRAIFPFIWVVKGAFVGSTARVPECPRRPNYNKTSLQPTP